MTRTICRFVSARIVDAMILVIRFYQIAISPILGPSCNFQPTCSRYMMDALRKYGVFRGGWKGLRRIARCHPWNPGGYDPA